MLQFLTTYSCEFVEFLDGDVTSAGIWYLGRSGECDDEQFETEDSVVLGARSSLTISMIAGFAAFAMILFEWLLCEVCCAGILEGLAICVAWMVGGATFAFYGSEYCVEGGLAAEIIEEDDITCEYAQASSFLAAACFLYLCAGVLLCW